MKMLLSEMPALRHASVAAGKSCQDVKIAAALQDCNCNVNSVTELVALAEARMPDKR